MNADRILADVLRDALGHRLLASAHVAESVAAIALGSSTPQHHAIIVRNIAALGRTTFSADTLRRCRYAATALVERGIANQSDFPGVL